MRLLPCLLLDALLLCFTNTDAQRAGRMRTIPARDTTLAVTVVKDVAISEKEEDMVIADSGDESNPLTDIYSPHTANINKPDVADAYPFISGDGLRLYFTSNREGGHGRFFVSKRSSLNEPFGVPVVLSKHLTDGYYAGTLTSDELAIYMLKNDVAYVSVRPDINSEFGAPMEIKGLGATPYYAPSISPDGKEMVVVLSSGTGRAMKIYRTKGNSKAEVEETGEISVPDGFTTGPGQFSKDGLSYYLSFEADASKPSMWRYSRQSLDDKFQAPVELTAQTDLMARLSQPSVNGDGSIFVSITSPKNLWDGDDIVLVGGPGIIEKEPGTAVPVPQVTLKSEAVAADEATVASVSSVKVYPNPARQSFVLSLDKEPAQGVQLRLFNASGNIVKQQRINSKQTTIAFGNLAPGIYIYQVINAAQKVVGTGKIIRQ